MVCYGVKQCYTRAKIWANLFEVTKELHSWTRHYNVCFCTNMAGQKFMAS